MLGWLLNLGLAGSEFVAPPPPLAIGPWRTQRAAVFAAGAVRPRSYAADLPARAVYVHTNIAAGQTLNHSSTAGQIDGRCG